MTSILIQNVLHNNNVIDLLVEDNKIAKIGPNINTTATHTIDGTGKGVVAGFINGHTHAAMTLFGGFADDMKLHDWLTQKIWPNEARLTEQQVYWGTRLACLEMVKSGTTLFNDMYFFPDAIHQAVIDSGIRGVNATTLFDTRGEAQLTALKKKAKQYITKNRPATLQVALGPHAIYTNTKESLQWAQRMAEEYNLLLHIHLSETKEEVDDVIKNWGCTPVEYLYQLGLLTPKTVAAHCVWLSDKDIELIAKTGTKVVHNPASNMKLASGIGFRYHDLKTAGVTIGLGTDGCSSSNNLDMVEAMKLASLLAKATSGNPAMMPIEETLALATSNGAKIFGIEAGEIAVGKLADFSLVDLKRPEMVPNHNFLSNLIYASNGSCIDTVICDGKMVMLNKVVKDEAKIMEEASACAEALFYKTSIC